MVARVHGVSEKYPWDIVLFSNPGHPWYGSARIGAADVGGRRLVVFTRWHVRLEQFHSSHEARSMRPALIWFELNAWEPQLDAALIIINNWRSSHSFPLNTFHMGLRRRVDRIAPWAATGVRSTWALSQSIWRRNWGS